MRPICLRRILCAKPMRRVLTLLLLAGIAVPAGVLAAGALANGDGDRGPGRITAIYSFDASRGMPTEGSVSYVVLRRKPGGVVLRAELRGDTDKRSVSAPVRGGRYRISAYQRLCEGNCTDLSPPSHGCGRDIRVADGRSLTARIRVRWTAANAEDQPQCRISLSR